MFTILRTDAAPLSFQQEMQDFKVELLPGGKGTSINVDSRSIFFWRSNTIVVGIKEFKNCIFIVDGVSHYTPVRRGQ